MKKHIKKILPLILTIAAISNSFGIFSQTAAAAAETVIYGDTDQDKTISAGDALCVLKSVVGLIKPDDGLKKVMDVDADGDITAADALCILKYVVGLIDHFDAETAKPTDPPADDQIICPECGAPGNVIWDSHTVTGEYDYHYICNGCNKDFGHDDQAAILHIAFSDFYGPCQNYRFAPVAFYDDGIWWDYNYPYQRAYPDHRHYKCSNPDCFRTW